MTDAVRNALSAATGRQIQVCLTNYITDKWIFNIEKEKTDHSDTSRIKMIGLICERAIKSSLSRGKNNQK